jgi:hypothetical protein
MEKLNRIPQNNVTKIEVEHYADPMYSNQAYFQSIPNPYGQRAQYKTRLKAEIVIDMNNEEDREFIYHFQKQGLEYVAKMGFDIEKFRYVINEGFIRLPALIKHPDPEIAKMAWILSKYFSQRNDIMPEQVIE